MEMITRSWRDVFYADLKQPRHREYRDTALDWFLDESLDPASFRWCCLVNELDWESMREFFVDSFLADEPPRRCHRRQCLPRIIRRVR